MKREDRKFASKVVEREDIEDPVQPVNPPIYSSSTYVLDSAAHGARLSSKQEPEEGESPYLYTRWSNPTTDVAARIITKLENGHRTYTTSTGMAAITTALFSHLTSGDHVVAPEPVYGGTHELFSETLPSYGIEVTWVDGTDPQAYRDAIQENTKVIYGETPANPTMSLCDLSALGKISRELGIISMVDSTFGTPYNQTPIDHGINIVIHSATKYLGGHSDIVAGSITVDNESSAKNIFQTLKLFGGTQSPYDAFLLVRGIKTLDVRMKRHNSNAMKIARFLQDHENVERVYYPGLPSHPQHELAKKQMRNGFGGMVAFEVVGGLEAGTRVIENLGMITLAVSLGGVESLIEQASTMTHTMVPREERLKGGITDGLLRFSVGIEDPDDLINDLSDALALLS